MERSLPAGLFEETMLQAVRRNEETEKRWTAVKRGYRTALEGLNAFPKELQTNCLIPLTKRAMIPGRLIHTNEVLVRLGGEYFSRVSAARAIEYCNRQIKTAERMLKELADERNFHETRLLTLEDLSAERAMDLTEHWTEDRLENWREKHRARQKEYRERMARERETREKDGCERDAEEIENAALFDRLDELEILESMKEELEGSDTDYSDSDSDSDSDLTDQEAEELSANEEEEEEEEEEEDEPVVKETDGESGERPKKLVSFSAELARHKEHEDKAEEELEPVRIRFSHTKLVEQTPRQIEQPVEEGPEIRSPADIHRLFSGPRSILKKAAAGTVIPVDRSLLANHEEEPDSGSETEEEFPGASAYETVVRDVREKKPSEEVQPAPDAELPRPLSKFKRERSSKR